MVFCANGCAWRTGDADHVFGPTFYRFNQPSLDRAFVFQTLHVPLLVEGGRQWGFSVGGVQRLALVPGEAQPAKSQTDSDEPPRGWFVQPQPGHWQFSALYLRAPLRKPPVFISRTLVGLHGGAGAEERTISLGYSSTTATAPREEALYRLEFDTHHPLDATFVMQSRASAEESKSNPSLNKGQP